jgi:hypothetical protein
VSRASMDRDPKIGNFMKSKENESDRDIEKD